MEAQKDPRNPVRPRRGFGLNDLVLVETGPNASQTGLEGFPKVDGNQGHIENVDFTTIV